MMKVTKRMKYVFTALMASMIILSAVSFAEAGIKLDDVQILVRMKDKEQPPAMSKVPRLDRYQAPSWNPRHDRSPKGPERHRWVHDGPKAPRRYNRRDVPPPPPPPHGHGGPHPGRRR